MISLKNIRTQIPFSINDGNFEEIALSLFRIQAVENEVYRDFVKALRISTADVKSILNIPFLPVSFFKTHTVSSAPAAFNPLIFESSTTTGSIPSRHFVSDAQLYETSLLQGFHQFYGNVDDYVILALLPSYLERKNASLVFMAQTLMDKSAHPENGFYLDDMAALAQKITELEQRGQKTLLLGVTFALLDFATAFPLLLTHTIVMETGGMKGRREEWTRKQVHQFLQEKWKLEQVHSEYGMTEMLSQAYAQRDGIFNCSATMRVLVREVADPLTTFLHGVGQLQIIDLANVFSCAFLASEDLGKVYADGTFEVTGRADHTALRGCSLMHI